LAPMLDPLNLAKGLNKENPKEWAKQNLMYRLLPDQYMTEVLGFTPGSNTADPSALQHIQVLSSGQDVPPEIHPTKEHLATHQAFMNDPQFKTLPPEIQTLHMNHVQQELATAKQEMGMQDKPGMPPEQQQPTPGVSGDNPASPNPGTPSSNGAQTPPQGTPRSAIINPTIQ